LTLVPYLSTISIHDLQPGPRYLWCILKPGINININNWEQGFTVICLFFCRYASGDLVEPMSASECFMLIFILSPSRRLIQVLVGDVHCRVFSWFVYRIKCKTMYSCVSYIELFIKFIFLLPFSPFMGSQI
jgi:hypothetical protein